jgi:5S rRNA maturation endonuclease (ribonuclease M5)
MTAVAGHLTQTDFEEAYSQWTSCDPFVLFDAPVRTFVQSNHKDIETNLQTEARRSDMLMIWTDCDREGEHIGKEIATVCRRAKPNIIVKRARFSAIIAPYVSTRLLGASELTSSKANTSSRSEPGTAGPRAGGRSGSPDSIRPEDWSGFHSPADAVSAEGYRTGQEWRGVLW